jgi:imidazolonepropionase-like amidohydrolase
MPRICVALLLLALVPLRATAQSEGFAVIYGGRTIGHLNATTEGGSTTIDYDYKDNGRGPTLKESIAVDAAGVPTVWSITGSTAFGNKVDEQFTRVGDRAEWSDASGPGGGTFRSPVLYVPQVASPWSLGLIARALLKAPAGSMAALPAGTVRLETRDTIAVEGGGGGVRATTYGIAGIGLNPDYVLLDDAGALFAYITPSFVVVRRGYEKEEAALRALADRLEANRYVEIEQQVAHRHASPVRIRNVRVFDPRRRSLSQPVSVVVHGREIAAIEAADLPGTPGEVSIDGANGTLVPGMYEMHGHLSQDEALLNLAAGITTIRDMGNTNAVLDQLVARIDSGVLGGPRVVRSGFIEGKSPFNSNSGIVVESEAEALAAVRWYASRGYWQIKIYNSMNPAWVPAVVREAHGRGLRVAGHVPAFSTADAMIAAGYDEITHINQFMLGWVLQPGEDTRTLLRLTALRRLGSLDLNSAPVQKTIEAMVQRKVAIDPTLAIHEELTENRDGRVPPGAADYLDHMPIAYQRGARRGRVDVSAPGDDAAYRAAFEKILATVKMLHDRGVFVVPGTDLGGSFTFHRELELYLRAGIAPAEILARATLETARYLGQDQRLGSIEKGKLADFFLIPGDPTRDLKAIKTIQMVVKDGIVYFPSEIYPHFGIRPFAQPPAVTGAVSAAP